MSKFDDLLDSFSQTKLVGVPLLEKKNSINSSSGTDEAPVEDSSTRNDLPTIDEVLAVSLDNTGNLHKLKEQFRRIPPVPYIGAGLSMVPSWKGLLEKVASRMYINSSDFMTSINNGMYERAAQILHETDPRMFYLSLEDVLHPRNIATYGENLSPALKVLPYLCKGVLITTNFDRCIERAYQRHDRFMTPGDLPTSQLEVELPTIDVNALRHRIQEDEHFLLKVHGDALTGQSSLVFTREQYDRYYGLSGAKGTRNKPMRRVIREVLLTRTLLFIGCSLEKDRSMDVLMEEAEKQDVKDVRGYSFAIVQKPHNERLFHDKFEYLSNMRIRPIWYPENQHQCIITILYDILADGYHHHKFINECYDRISRGASPDVRINIT